MLLGGNAITQQLFHLVVLKSCETLAYKSYSIRNQRTSPDPFLASADVETKNVLPDTDSHRLFYSQYLAAA